jgi:hypothetical protein
MDGATAWGDFYLTLASALAAKRLPVAVILDGPRRSEALA